MKGVVHTIGERCKRCFTCVRECPAHAVRISGGQAVVLEDRCLSCGHCVSVCSQGAKSIEDAASPTSAMLADPETKTIAILAPSFPSYTDCDPPDRFVGALRALGFDAVMEVAFGADLVAAEYGRIYRSSTGSQITTPCPSIYFYVCKYMPELISRLSPVVSPMIAMGRLIKWRLDPSAKVVFIGPCVAKKSEAEDPSVAGVIDAVLTFRELRGMFADRGIDPAACEPAGFDGPAAGRGRLFPVSGGLLVSAGVARDLEENEVIVAEGKNRAIPLLKSLGEGGIEPRFLDILFCEGCVNGPFCRDRENIFTNRDSVLRYYRETRKGFDEERWRRDMAEAADIDLARSFVADTRRLPMPSEDQIDEQLRRMGKTGPKDELNCGACGYRSCREHAIDVLRGLAESEMCLPYTVDQLESTLGQLEESNRRFRDAQQQLIQNEKMAAMGQLAAGVAHEVNNPLGTVLLYSHMILESLEGKDPNREDLSIIVRETERCRRIVADLLDFARQNKLVLSNVDLESFLRDTIEPSVRAPENAAVRFDFETAPIPEIAVDADQVRQVVLNVVQNALEAMERRGRIVVRLYRSPDGDRAVMEFVDDGPGIPENALPRIFTPFFTTKPIGKGTGLGLAIAYGIVKLHRGDIAARNGDAGGATLRVEIPYGLGETATGEDTFDDG